MKTNQAGVDLIKEFEGFRGYAYLDAVGVLTIGYGHTSRAGEPKVKPGMTITEEEGENILKKDLIKFENYVKDILKEDIHKINENQFAACVSLCYNIGPGNFKKSSVVRFIRATNLPVAADMFLLWNKAGGKVLRGLVRRRRAERDLFLKEIKVT